MSPSHSAAARAFLSSLTFWVTCAYFLLLWLTVGLYVVNGKTSKAIAKQEAATASAIVRQQSAADAAYKACLVSIPALNRVNRFVDGVKDLHVALLENAVANHKATPPGTDVYRQQVVNIARLARTVDAVNGVRFPVPTKAECADRKKRLLASTP